jgi:hypothetical protein
MYPVVPDHNVSGIAGSQDALQRSDMLNPSTAAVRLVIF